MKVYELRDTTSDEMYYSQGMFSAKEKAIKAMEEWKGDINEASEDFVTATIYEWDLDSLKEAVKVLEKSWEKNYGDEIKEEWLEVIK